MDLSPKQIVDRLNKHIIVLALLPSQNTFISATSTIQMHRLMPASKNIKIYIIR